MNQRIMTDLLSAGSSDTGNTDTALVSGSPADRYSPHGEEEPEASFALANPGLPSRVEISPAKLNSTVCFAQNSEVRR